MVRPAGGHAVCYDVHVTSCVMANAARVPVGCILLCRHELSPHGIHAKRDRGDVGVVEVFQPQEGQVKHGAAKGATSPKPCHVKLNVRVAVDTRMQ